MNQSGMAKWAGCGLVCICGSCEHVHTCSDWNYSQDDCLKLLKEPEDCIKYTEKSTTISSK